VSVAAILYSISRFGSLILNNNKSYLKLYSSDGIFFPLILGVLDGKSLSLFLFIPFPFFN
jgi:hypothetical protein